MPMLVQCKNGHTLRVKDEALGKKVRCPQCQTVVVVDDEAGDAEDSPSPQRKTSAGAATTKSRGKSRSKKKAGGGGLVWMIAGGAGVGLVVVGVGLFLLLRPAPSQNAAVVQGQAPAAAPQNAQPAPQPAAVVAVEPKPGPVSISPNAKRPPLAAEPAKAAPTEPATPEVAASPAAEPETSPPEPAKTGEVAAHGVTVWDASAESGAAPKSFTAAGENWTVVSSTATLPQRLNGDCVLTNGKIWLHISRDQTAPIRVASKGDANGQDVVLPIKLGSEGAATGPRVCEIVEISGDSVRVKIGDEANALAVCRITTGKYWVEFIPEQQAQDLTLDVNAKFVVLPTEFGEDEICDADWALQRSESSVIPLPRENMVLALEQAGNHMSILTYPSIEQAGELKVAADNSQEANTPGGSTLSNSRLGGNLSGGGTNAPSASGVVKSVSAKFEGNSVFACLLPQQGLWQSEVVTKKYSAPGHYPITGKTLAPGIWRIGARIVGKKGPQFYVSEYPNTNLLFECRQSGTMQCLFYYLFRPVEGESGGALTPMDIYRETVGEAGTNAYLLETEQAGRLFHRDTKYRGVCGCVDDMKDVWRKQPQRLATDAAYFTNQLSDCKTIIDHMDVRLHEYEGMAQHLAAVLEQIDAADVSKDDSAAQTYLSVVRSNHNSLKSSIVVDANRAYTLLEEVEAKIHAAANKKISLSDLDKQIEKVRDVANKQEDQLKKFRGIYLTLSKASLNFREKAEDPLKPYVLAIGHDCRRMLRTRGRAE